MRPSGAQHAPGVIGTTLLHGTLPTWQVPGTRLGVDGNCEGSLFDDLAREPAIFANHSARPNAVIEHWPRMGAGPGATEGERHRLEQESLPPTTYYLLLLLTSYYSLFTIYYLLLTTVWSRRGAACG